MTTYDAPRILSRCADCGIGTLTLGEYYMVKDDVWEQAWAGRRKAWHGKVPGQEILCIGCLEQRIGRTLTSSDFTDAPVNDLTDPDISDRFRDRLTTTRTSFKTADSMFNWLAAKTTEELPESLRDAMRQSWAARRLKP
jgi:hypothetical protein